MASPESSPRRPSRDAIISYAAYAAVLAGTYVYLLLMAHLEPITGDGWCVAADMHKAQDVATLFTRMHSYYVRWNPRFGQLFTFLTYSGGWFHQVVTPLIFSAWSVLAVFHATGRWPAPGSLRSAGLLLLAFAAGWLVLPQAGDALFYRPIATNYTYSVVLILAYFVPLRLDLRAQRLGRALGLGLVMLVAGVLVGMLNEHTGPALMLAAALSTALALRARRRADAVWRGAATLGLSVGFLLLFFAPGQSHRYGKLGHQSVLDTLLNRGFAGTFELVELMWDDVAKVLAATFVLFVVYVATGNDRSALNPRASAGAPERIWPWVYVAVAIVMFGTALAAPKHTYRLFIAPSMLVAVGMVGIVDLMWNARAVRILACAGALIVHAVFIARSLEQALEIHEVDVRRTAILRAGGTDGVAVVPPLPYARGNAFFFGDTAKSDARCRKCMARLYGVKAVRYASDKPHGKHKVKRKGKHKKRKPPKPL